MRSPAAIRDEVLVFDDPTFAAHAALRLRESAGRAGLYGIRALDLGTFVRDVLQPILCPDTVVLPDRHAVKLLYDCLRAEVGDNSEHVLSPCIEYPAYRFDLYELYERLALSSLDPAEAALALSVPKWDCLARIFASYRAALARDELTDYPLLVERCRAVLTADPDRAASLPACTLDGSAARSHAERRLIGRLAAACPAVSLADDFTGPAGMRSRPEVDVSVFPTVESQIESILARILSSGKPLERTALACSDYDAAVRCALSFIDELPDGCTVPLRFPAGIPVTESLALSLFRKLLTFSRERNLPAFFMALLSHPLFAVPKGKDSMLAPRAAIIRILAEFPSYLDMSGMAEMLAVVRRNTPTEDPDYRRRREACCDSLGSIFASFSRTLAVLTDGDRGEDEKLAVLARLFDAFCDGRNRELERSAHAEIIEGLREFVREELPYLRGKNGEAVRRRLADTIAARRIPFGNETGLAVVPLDFAFGLPVDELYATGLSYQALPGREAANPLVSDAEIERLNSEIGEGRIPDGPALNRYRAYREKKLLATPRRTLHISYVFTEGENTAPPADILLRYVQEQSPQACETLEGFLAAAGGTGDIHRIYLENAERLRVQPLSRHAALENPELLARLHAPFHRFSRVLSARLADAEATDYDGRVAEAGELSWRTDGGPAVFSATRVQDLLQCPFRFFLKYILHAEPVARPEPWDEVSWLDPFTRGTVYHAILDALVSGAENGSPPGPKRRPEDMRARIAVTVERYLEDLREQLLPPETIFRHEARIILDTIVTIVETERERFGADGFVTTNTEATFGMACKSVRPENLLCAEPVPVRLSAERGVLFRGSIDRIDRTADGRRALLLDYKTGKCRLKKKDPDSWMNGGDYIQHIVYGLIFESLAAASPETEIESGYYFIPENGEHDTCTAPYRALRDRFIRLLDTAFETIESEGRFYRNADSCGYCDYASACLHERGKHTEGTARLCDSLAGRSLS